LLTFFLACLCIFLSTETVSADQWILSKVETFDSDAELKHGQTFGEAGWLTATLRGKGSITISNGFAHFRTPNFPDSALLRVTDSLPREYRLRVRLGRIDYDTANYDAGDLANPGFKYKSAAKGGGLENGFYWITLTDRLVEENSGEDWWHRYRKVVIDSDDHKGVQFPVYMVYMNPDLDRSVGDWTGGRPHLLRTWSNGRWHSGAWDWEAAFNYRPDAYYEVEIEKAAGKLILRAFDGSGGLIAETAPVDQNDVYSMGVHDSGVEYAYVGEPHIDSYKGEAYVDSISLWQLDSKAHETPRKTGGE